MYTNGYRIVVRLRAHKLFLWRGTKRIAAFPIAAQVLPCDQVNPPVLPDEYTPSVVQVVVRRPIGPPCGTPTEQVLALYPAFAMTKLPTNLVHAPTGLVFPQPQPTSPPTLFPHRSVENGSSTMSQVG